MCRDDAFAHRVQRGLYVKTLSPSVRTKKRRVFRGAPGSSEGIGRPICGGVGRNNFGGDAVPRPRERAKQIVDCRPPPFLFCAPARINPRAAGTFSDFYALGEAQRNRNRLVLNHCPREKREHKLRWAHQAVKLCKPEALHDVQLRKGERVFARRGSVVGRELHALVGHPFPACFLLDEGKSKKHTS